MKTVLSAFILLFISTVCAVAQSAGAAAALTAAMESLEAGDWQQAKQRVAPAGQTGIDIIDWHRLRAGNGNFDEYFDFLDRRDDWPGLPLLQKQGEASIPISAKPDKVIAFFAEMPPQTGTGSLRLAAALRATGETDKAQREIVRAWRSFSLGKSEQAEFLQNFGDDLVNHHRARQDMLLWRGMTTQASRLNGLVGSDYKALANARIGLLGKEKGVSKLIRAVPAALADDPGLAFARFQWRLKNRQSEGAVAMILAQSRSAKALGQPDAWGDQRRVLARQKMRAGKTEMAYQLAANHYLTSGDNFLDLEWLAGYIALTGLNKPAVALKHFQQFRSVARTPISLGRAGYWEGRALDALGQTETARAAYAFAAEYQTSFYGQLAAEKAHIPMDRALTGRNNYPDYRALDFYNGSVFQAARLFHKAEMPLLFTRFSRHLAEVLDEDENGALAQFALDKNQTYTALYLAKFAAKSGVVIPRPYFPVPDILSPDMKVIPELTLSIMRRESEFYPVSTSAAGASGLMQLMPRTARAMAKRLNMPFSSEKLLSDPNYNAALGSAYLAVLVDEFGPYYPFVAAGYNAGPSRPKKWAAQFGNPKRSTEAAVDWIEHIPFRETRNYVMRVMESLAVYRARLSGKTSPLRLSQDLIGR